MFRQQICHDDLIGTLFTSDKKQPGIILLSGSDGGIPGTNAIPESFIEYLVQNDFSVLALAYFGVESLPSHLENIPLEYFESAINWFKDHPQVDTSYIGVIGQSRGAELALLLGSLFPDLFQAIVACAPCHTVCGGFPYPNRSAWIHHSTAVPHISAFSNFENDLTEVNDMQLAMDHSKIPYHANSENDPCIISDLFLARHGTIQSQQAQIAVERIHCPILLLSGDEDAIWPSKLYCDLIAKRLQEHNFKFFLEHINYKNAGHGILSSFEGSIYHPVGEFWCKLGGTSKGNQAANEQSWVAIVRFLKEFLT